MAGENADAAGFCVHIELRDASGSGAEQMHRTSMGEHQPPRAKQCLRQRTLISQPLRCNQMRVLEAIVETLAGQATEEGNRLTCDEEDVAVPEMDRQDEQDLHGENDLVHPVDPVTNTNRRWRDNRKRFQDCS